MLEDVVSTVEDKVEIHDDTMMTANIMLPNAPNSLVKLKNASSGAISGKIATAMVPIKNGIIYQIIVMMPAYKNPFFAALSDSADNPRWINVWYASVVSAPSSTQPRIWEPPANHISLCVSGIAFTNVSQPPM